MNISKPPQHSTIWTGRLLLLCGIVALSSSFVPLQVMKDLGARLNPYPYAGLQEKTLLLFQALKIVLAPLGMAGIVWLAGPRRMRRAVSVWLRDLLSSARAVFVILLLGLLLRLGWVAFFPAGMYADSQWYFEKAVDLSRGLGYVHDSVSLQPTAAWPVGYPAFLAGVFSVTGASLSMAKLANAMLGVLSVTLTYAVAKRIFGRMVANLSALFIAILPGLIVYTSLVNSDLMFMTLVIGIFWFSLTNGPRTQCADWRGDVFVFCIGLVNGAMILTRSVGIALFPFWILVRWMATRVDTVRPMSIQRWIGLLTVGTVLIVMPWTVRNYIDFHKLIPVSNNGGTNFWIGNNPLAFGGFIFPKQEADNPLLPLLDNEIAADEMGYKLGLEFIQSHPLQAIRLMPAKVFFLYNSNDFGLEWNRSSLPDHLGVGPHAHMFVNLIYTILFVTSILGVLLLGLKSPREPLAWTGVIFAIYWTLLHLPFFGQDRFALPVLPFLMMYAAFGLVGILGLGIEFETLAGGKDRSTGARLSGTHTPI